MNQKVFDGVQNFCPEAAGHVTINSHFNLLSILGNIISPLRKVPIPGAKELKIQHECNQKHTNEQILDNQGVQNEFTD